MYTPSSFKETDSKVIIELIEANSFGVLFSQHEDAPWATHLPFMLDIENDTPKRLITHMARANKHWKNLDESKEVLAVFSGPHTYITPSWYKNRETVPTWNYATVHVQGSASIIHDVDELKAIVTELTQHHESQVKTDWSLSEGEKEMAKDLRAIVGVSIQINHIDAKFKFNQNRSKDDQKGVIEGLKGEKGAAAQSVIDIMQKNLDKK